AIWRRYRVLSQALACPVSCWLAAASSAGGDGNASSKQQPERGWLAMTKTPANAGVFSCRMSGWRGPGSAHGIDGLAAHLLEQRDGENRGERVEAGDDNEHRGPASRLLLEECRRRPAQDRAHALRDVEKAIVGGGVFRPERVGERRGKQ